MATALPSKPASLSRANAPQTRGLWSTACFPPSCSHRIHGAPAVHHPEHLDMSGSQRRSSSTLTSPLRPPRTASSWRTAAFEPSAPGAAQIASMATVLASTLATGLYWWLVVVPSERASLSRQKRKGAVKEYLEELEQDTDRKAERWFYTEWRDKLQKRKQLNAWGAASTTTDRAADQATSNSTNAAATTDAPTIATTTTPATTNSATADAEAAAASTQLQQGVSQSAGDKGPRQDEKGPSQNFLEPTYENPMPRFFSLDNPIVFVFAVLGLMVLATSIITGGR